MERLVRRGSASEGGNDTHRPFAHKMDGFRFPLCPSLRCKEDVASISQAACVAEKRIQK